jgi:hypothetical protein
MNTPAVFLRLRSVLLLPLACMLLSPQYSFAQTEPDSSAAFSVSMHEGKAGFYHYGEPMFIEGVGGKYKLSKAASYGVNAFRTWSAERAEKDLSDAQQSGMYMMLGIWLSQNLKDYSRPEYREEMTAQLQSLLDRFKTHPNLMLWCLGNEVDWDAETAPFLEELAQTVRKQDPNHPVCAVVQHNAKAVDAIAMYAPSVQIIGFNTYGGIYGMQALFEKSKWKGPYIVSEWGPTGWWENPKTNWGAPIEPTSSQKQEQYRERYTRFIKDNPQCIGSFVFLWGQKEERTPTWFGLFAEENVDGLPLRGEAYATVEAMEELWTGKEAKEKAPVVGDISLNGKKVNQTDTFQTGQTVEAKVDASDPRNYPLTFHWELLKEATVLGNMGSYEPRPDRVGKVITGKTATQKIRMPAVAGNYRLFVYVLNGRGMAGTSNIPFQVK